MSNAEDAGGEGALLQQGAGSLRTGDSVLQQITDLHDGRDVLTCTSAERMEPTEEEHSGEYEDSRTTILSPTRGGSDYVPVKGARLSAPESEEDFKVSERNGGGISQSVKDEVSSTPISEVDDLGQGDEVEVSSKLLVRDSHSVLDNERPRPESQGSVHQSSEEEQGDDNFGATREEMDSSRPLPSQEVRRRSWTFADGRPAEARDDGKWLPQPSEEPRTAHQHQEHDLSISNGHANAKLGRMESVDANSNAASESWTPPPTEPRNKGEDEETAWQLKLDSDLGVYYPDLEEEISPFSLEERIRKARECQDQEWQAENSPETRLLTKIVASASQSQLNSEDSRTHSNLSELEGISSTQLVDSCESSSDSPLPSEPEEGREIPFLPEILTDDEGRTSHKQKVGAGEAVLLGVLASGVNAETWITTKMVLVALVASLFLLLPVALQSESRLILANVFVLIVIAAVLILLLRWYISEIGLVSVDKQMMELNLTPAESSKVESKTL